MTENKANEWPLFIRKMTSKQIEEAVKTIKIALMPVGSLEQHGPHLPIDTDLSTVEYLAEESVKRVRGETGQPIALIVPALPFGITLEMEWPGHLHLRSSTHISVLGDIGGQLVKSGFRYVVFLNGCVGNISTVNVVATDLKTNYPDNNFVVLHSTWSMPEAIVRNSGPGGTGHACEVETSTQLVIDPEHVYMDKAVDQHLKHPSPLISYDFDVIQPFHWPEYFHRMTKSGVVGDATKATKENGRKILEANIKRIADILRHFHELN